MRTIDWRRLFSSSTAVAGGVLVAVVVMIALLARFVSPYPPIQMSLHQTFAPPQASHLLGTDEFGRDVLSRVFDGARASLLISLAAVVGAMTVGGTLALVVGYIGGVLDVVFTRVVDILLAIPALLIALGVVALAGPSGTSVAVALAVAYVPTVARVVRSAVVAARVQPYVEASVGMGASTATVLLGDILPNILPVLLVQSMVTVAWAILDEVADALNGEFDADFVGRSESELDFSIPVDRTLQSEAIKCHVSQSGSNPVLRRRLELTGDVEYLRWLTPASTS